MTQLRDKERAILHQIHEGNSDTQQIKSATTLTNREITYSLDKLEDQGLITVDNPGGTVTRIIDGQKRVFQHPKTAELTEQGQKHLSEDLTDTYEDLSHQELVQRVRALEEDVEELQDSLNTFREQVQNRL